jgi:hypothetical protein
MDTCYMANEADTCRKHVIPKLIESGWGHVNNMTVKTAAQQYRAK